MRRDCGGGRMAGMPGIARVVVPGLPHHITQRGNRRADVFFDDDDRRRYLFLLGQYAERHGLAIWAYCLMKNHVHFRGRPVGRGVPGMCLSRHAPSLRGVAEPQDVRERPLMAGPLLLVRAGRSAHVGVCEVRRAESRAGRRGRAGRGLAVVERRGPLRAARRSAAVACPDALAGAGLVGVSRPRRGCRRRHDPPPDDDRPPVRVAGVHRAVGIGPVPVPGPPKTKNPAENQRKETTNNK